MRSHYKIYFITAALICFSSCKKFTEIDPPSTALAANAMFHNDQGAVAAVAGVYSQMGATHLNYANGGLTLFPGLSSDNLYNTTANSTYDPYKNNALTPELSSIGSRFWDAGYKTLYQVNAIIEGVAKSGGMTEVMSRQVKGEMLFLRAFHYFYLINLFGDVPYITSTDYRVNAVMPRTNTSEIYNEMINDLKVAKEMMPETYAGINRGRPNKWTAAALLARVYLYTGNWTYAEEEASSVINAGMYHLASQPGGVFQTNSTEILWRLLRENSNTAEGITFVPSSATARPAFGLHSSLISLFEQGDQRLASWTGKNIVSGQTYYYPYKYKVRTTTPVSEYLAVMRLAEIYLIRAEARLKQNKLNDARADVNTIRNRAGLSNTSAADAGSIAQAIEDERRKELFAEWGHRWLDLKRTGRADDVLSVIKGSNWQSTDQLYPIPQREMDRNPILIQNPGY